MGTLRVTVQLIGGHIAMGQQEDQHVIPLDRPVETGGTGLGFNGGHLMLLGWGACFKSNLMAAAEARGVTVTDLRLDISGETATTPARFGEVKMVVSLEADTDEATKEKLLTIGRNGCIASNTLEKGASMSVELA